MNRITILGRVGYIRQIVSNGQQIGLNFSVATAEYWINKKTNEKESRTEWHNVVFFSTEKRLNFFTKYMQKGAHVFVDGDVRYETYIKDEIERTTTKIYAKEIKLFLTKQDRESIHRGKEESEFREEPEQYTEEDSIPF